jgi:hypothetical protein
MVNLSRLKPEQGAFRRETKRTELTGANEGERGRADARLRAKRKKNAFARRGIFSVGLPFRG